jgi:hypothetical protein
LTNVLCFVSEEQGKPDPVGGIVDHEYVFPTEGRHLRAILLGQVKEVF